MTGPRIVARKTVVVAVLSLWASSMLAFDPAVSAPFIFDDLPSIQNNPTIRQLWPPSVPLSPPGRGMAVSGRPVANYSLAVDFALNRALKMATNDTRAFHITNMMLHFAAALLVFGIVRSVFRVGAVPESWRASGDTIAFTVAAIWSLHPLQTEAVNYLSQRTELLVSVFYLATVYCAVRAWSSRHVVAWSAGAVAACALGMGSKEVMLTAPIVVVLFDRAFIVDSWQSAARRRLYAALIATSVISVVLVMNGARSDTVGFHSRISWYEYLYSQGWAIGRYLELSIWPSRLVIDYGRDAVHDSSGIPGVIGLTILFVVTIWLWTRPQLKWLGFLGAWFFLALAPSSSVVPIVTEIAAERRMYLALVALVIAAVVGVEHWRRSSMRTSLSRYATPSVVGLAVILLVSMTGATRARSRLYNDPESLWRDALSKRPQNPRALEGLAVAILQKDTTRIDEADTLYARAARLDSTATNPLVSRAAIAIKQRRTQDAHTLLEHALRLAPDDSAANQAFGQVLSTSAHPELGIPYLRRLAVTSPSVETLTNLGTAFLLSGHLDSAIVILGRATQIDMQNPTANRNLGAALVESGRGTEAILPLSRSAQADSSAGFTLALLALAYAEAHRPEPAMQAAHAAVLRSPDDAQTFSFAGRAAQYASHYPEAISFLERAIRLDSADVQAPTRLGFLLASTGKIAEGTRMLQGVIARAPDYEPARVALARVSPGSNGSPPHAPVH